MSLDLQLKSQCGGCGSSKDLYGSQCKHLTLCLTCGKTMAENRGKCYDCGATISRLIREYNVRASSSSDKNFFIGRFGTGLPNFPRKQHAENKWTLQKEGLHGRQVTDTLREKYKNKPWLLVNETGQHQYHGQPEGAQSATYYLLISQAKEFVAIPAGSWYNFNKVAQYKQLTLEEAEEKMKNRRKTADGYERWMMKAANNGAAAFGEVERDDKESGGSGRGLKKTTGVEDEGNVSDKGEEDEEEEAARKSRLGLNKRSGDDDDEEGPRGGDLDLDDDDIEKGDDWEHEEIFTDDDEAVGNNAEEREELAPEIHAPPEIKQDEEDEDETNEEEGGLSKSGKELKKLLGRTGGLNESDAEDEDEDDDMEDDSFSPVLAPKQKDTLKEEPTDNSPSKPAKDIKKESSTPSKSSKGKRKTVGEDAKSSASGTPAKKVKVESDVKPPSKDENTKASVPSKGASASSSSSKPAPTSTGPVTEDEIRAVLMQKTPVTTQDLVAKFKSRLKTREDKDAFADILRRISKIHKTSNGPSYVVLREK
ncbi:transcription initiation factor IIF subunit alpha-like [Impatiens glandulifera]|uniref:transcription initiation factor IIF subunit alpha-like n=1 Tax=Impatiens glandulifera TaxID=253017 RepID=UPI001FB09A85|nr:transcription initiation factor IIF subunit alpha-like [Impatiens glandulifera]